MPDIKASAIGLEEEIEAAGQNKQEVFISNVQTIYAQRTSDDI